MKINQIIINETTTSGAFATVASPLGKTQTRNASIYGDKKVGSLFKGKKTSKPYANSLNEGKVKQLTMDLGSGPDGLSDTEFKKKYGKTKAEVRKEMKAKPEPQKEPVSEADLHEEDKIIAVGKGHKLKPGLLSKPENSINPTDTVKIDVPLLIRLLEYAREDASSDMDLHDLAEKLVDRGRRGKTLSMKDYEYVVDEVKPGGVVAGGGVGEAKVNEKAVSKAQQRFMGMAHAIQKGKKIPGASKELKDVAKGMSKKAAHDYAATKHKGLPEKVKKKD